MYRNGLVYKTLEQICCDAGFRIVYQEVPDDCIDGEILARADAEAKAIMMPESDCFESDEQAAFILGHEMAHILLGIGSPDSFYTRETNEAACNIAGAALASLAEEIAGARIERDMQSAARE